MAGDGEQRRSRSRQPASGQPASGQPDPGQPGPRPTPKALGGSLDPARRVRPVDWSATPRRRAPSTETSTESAPVAGSAPIADSAPTAGVAATDSTRRTGPSARLPQRRARTVELPRPVPSPPAAAVHSLTAEDPRPVPRPLRITDEDIRSVGVHGLSSEQIVQTVADPEDAWTADAGASDHFLRERIVVQVRRSDNAVIGLFSANYALSVRPAEYEPALDIAEDAAGPSARGGQGTRHPTSRRELLRRMEDEGFVITSGATHGRVTHRDHPGLVLPFASTPSDRRFTRHAVAQIRRVFGIDLRR